jgi:DNA-binding winged helix-turn-helix (wHTH) protein
VLRSQFIHWLGKNDHTVIVAETEDTVNNNLTTKTFDLIICEGHPRESLANAIWITDEISAKYKTIQFPFSVASLVTSIEVAVSSNEYKVATGFNLDQRRGVLYIDGVNAGLNQKEYDILAFIFNKDGGVVSRPDLLDEVWGMGSTASERAVDVAINRLRAKMGMYYIRLQSIRGGGYRWAEELEVH